MALILVSIIRHIITIYIILESVFSNYFIFQNFVNFSPYFAPDVTQS